MTKAYIVWNSDKTEGVVFSSEHDARNIATGNPSTPYPCIGEEFLEHHVPSDIQEIET